MNNTFLKGVFLLALVLPIFASTQYNLEIGFKVGPSNYLGEIGGKDKPSRSFVSDMQVKYTRFAVGAFARYRIVRFLAVQAAINHLKIQGSDALSTNPGRRGRNLNFKNDITDVQLRSDLYVFGINDVGHTGRYILDFKTYVFAGIAGFMHNPQGTYQSQWIDLQPLKTEGQSYSRFSFSVPAGAGFYMTFLRKHRFGLELTYHTTFTDYLDDISTVYADGLSGVSAEMANKTHLVAEEEGIPHIANYAPGNKRGDPNDNDAFIYAQFYYSYVLRGKNSFYRQNYSWMKRRGGRVRRHRAKF